MTMKTYWVSVILFIGFLGVLPPGVVRAESDAKEAAAKDQAKKKKTTEVSFEDVLVQGKYHFSDEAVTTVEQDKVLDALLGVRTDFKDRLKKSSARH
jgi:hypothetical protein